MLLDAFDRASEIWIPNSDGFWWFCGCLAIEIHKIIAVSLPGTATEPLVPLNLLCRWTSCAAEPLVPLLNLLYHCRIACTAKPLVPHCQHTTSRLNCLSEEIIGDDTLSYWAQCWKSFEWLKSEPSISKLNLKVNLEVRSEFSSEFRCEFRRSLDEVRLDEVRWG